MKEHTKGSAQTLLADRLNEFERRLDNLERTFRGGQEEVLSKIVEYFQRHWRLNEDFQRCEEERNALRDKVHALEQLVNQYHAKFRADDRRTHDVVGVGKSMAALLKEWQVFRSQSLPQLWADSILGLGLESADNKHKFRALIFDELLRKISEREPSLSNDDIVAMCESRICESFSRPVPSGVVDRLQKLAERWATFVSLLKVDAPTTKLTFPCIGSPFRLEDHESFNGDPISGTIVHVFFPGLATFGDALYHDTQSVTDKKALVFVAETQERGTP